MYRFSSRSSVLAPQTSIEKLEDRRLLSASPVTPLDADPSAVAALTLNANVGKKLKDFVGSWTIEGGVPAKSSGVVAVAMVDWGDGKTSRAKFVDDGSGIVQILASHAFKQTGTFQIVVKVQEYPRGHKTQLTDIGQADGSVTVAPKPTKVSVKGSSFTGTYTTPVGGNPDARSYDFTGTGTTALLGATDLTGTITPPGFIQSAPATGELTLTGADGSVTLDLIGKPQPGGSPIPQQMKYTITSGTGAFSNPTGKGTVAIAVDTDAGTFVIVIH